MTQIKRQPIPSLTGLRFLAALFVCTAHMTPHFLPATSLWYDNLTRISAEGMTLFFVLSGFVIHYNYSNSIALNPRSGLYQFFISRFARLVPLYLACIILDIFLTYQHNENYSSLSLPILFAKVAPYYLSLTQTWFYKIIGGTSLVYPFGWIMQLTWSISTEWFFYLVYPLICLALLFMPKIHTKLLAYTLITLAAICGVALLAINLNGINQYAIQTYGPVADFYTHGQDSYFRWLIYFSPYSRVAEFMIGCITAALYMQIAPKLQTSKRTLTGLLLTSTSIALVIISHYIIWNPPKGETFSWLPYLHRSFGFAPACSAVILCCALYKNVITQLLSTRLVLMGGEISYSMYLLHLVAINRVFHGKIHHYFRHFIDNLSPAPKYLLTMAVVFSISYLSYRAIEVPARRVIRKRFLRAKVVSVEEPVFGVQGS